MGGHDYTRTERSRRFRERQERERAGEVKKVQIAERLIGAFSRWEQASTPQEKRAARRWIALYTRAFRTAGRNKERRRIEQARG